MKRDLPRAAISWHTRFEFMGTRNNNTRSVLHGSPVSHHYSPPYPDLYCKTGHQCPMGCFASKPSAPVQESTPMRPVTPAVPVPTSPQLVPEPPAPVSRAPSHRSRKESTASTRGTQSQHGSTRRHRAESAPQRVHSLSSQGPRNKAETLGVPSASGTSRANRPGPRLSTPGKSKA